MHACLHGLLRSCGLHSLAAAGKSDWHIPSTKSHLVIAGHECDQSDLVLGNLLLEKGLELRRGEGFSRIDSSMAVHVLHAWRGALRPCVASSVALWTGMG